MSRDLAELLRETVARQGDHPALIGPGKEDCWSYAELLEAVDRAAAKLARAGVGARACVGLHCRSGREYIVLTYAVWSRGGCVVPIPVELTAREKAEICDSIGMSHVLSQASAASAVETYRCGPATELGAGSVVFPIESPKEHPPGFHQIDAAFIRFSSGTTGSAKGVVLSHESIRDRIQAANEVLRIGPDDRVVWLLSMSYHFAVSIVAYLSFGASIVLPEDFFGVSLVRAARKHRGSLIYGSPVHYLQMSKVRDDEGLPGLRLAISTTTGLRREIGQAFLERFGLPLTQAYGIIEVGLPCINIDFARDRCDAVGQVLPAYELALEAGDESLGLREIKLRGKGMLDAYYEPWRTRDQILDDGWFRTGDLGELDTDGCLHIRGRSKEVISVSGMKLFPQEVEQVLASHPAVREASVFAEPDERLGEVPHAQVVLKPGAQGGVGENELRDHCRERLAAFKVPARIALVESLQRTASGKILRRKTAADARRTGGGLSGAAASRRAFA